MPRSSSAQRRPASTTDPKPRTLIMGTGNLPRLCDTAHLATATSSRVPSLPTAAENRRASGTLPIVPTLQPCTGRRPGLKPAAPKPRVPPTRVATPAETSCNGPTAAPGALALSNTPHHATRALGLDPTRHINSLQGRRPPPHSYTPRPPGPDHTATVDLRCWKAGAGTPSPSLALDSAFPRMNGGHSGMFPIAKDSASLAAPPTPSGVGTGQKPPPAGTQMPPVRDPFLSSSGVSAGSPWSLCDHEHPPWTSTAAVEKAIPTLPVEPVVTPQPSANVPGVSVRRRADDSLLSSSRTGSEPRAPDDPQSIGAERATFGDVLPTRDSCPTAGDRHTSAAVRVGDPEPPQGCTARLNHTLRGLTPLEF